MEGPKSLQKLGEFGFTMTLAHTHISNKTSNLCQQFLLWMFKDFPVPRLNRKNLDLLFL